MSEARANRKSPVRIATVLSQREFALGAPRRTVASSITSSWYSVARWVSSTTTAAGTTRVGPRSPNCAASSTSSGRNRLPPAVDRGARTSRRADRTAPGGLAQPSSTRASPSALRRERASRAPRNDADHASSQPAARRTQGPLPASQIAPAARRAPPAIGHCWPRLSGRTAAASLARSSSGCGHDAEHHGRRATPTRDRDRR